LPWCSSIDSAAGQQVLLFGIDLGNSPLALLVVILSSALAMAVWVSSSLRWPRPKARPMGWPWWLVLTMAVVSGAMFPSISIPGLQLLTPHYWAMQGFINVISRGMGVEGVLLSTGILVSMAAIFFTLGAIRFRFE
jgi:ABC-2 type transport system permease protein